MPTSDLVERLRAVKSPEEVAAIRAAAELAQDALAEVLPTVRVGQTEQEIGARARGRAPEAGQRVAPVPYDRRLGASLRAPARAHQRPRRPAGGVAPARLRRAGRGYCADLTRTVVVGARADERQRTMYDLVRCAQGRALAHLRPGMTGREADALARESSPAAASARRSAIRWVTGLGLEVHEAPRLAATSEAALPPHTVVTVEPGVYFPGWGGVRLEDDLYLGDEGPELLSDGRTELVELV